jgi:hypothetical protein
MTTNTGHRNTGHCNAGNYNSGHSNTGDCNAGNYNSGHSNSGHRNTGHYNTGDCNTGDWNTGDWNTGNHNSGWFNTINGVPLFFNKPFKGCMNSVSFPYVNIILTEWIEEKDMTKNEKKENMTYKTTGGYLKEYTYKEAWDIYWRGINQSEKDMFINLPNFDPDIFEEITGICVIDKTVEITIDQTVELTIDQIADKFGIDASYLKIKK